MRRKLSTLLALSLVACGGSDSDSSGSFPTDKVGQAISSYKQVVNLSYADVLTTVTALQVAVDTFVAAPSQATQDAAKTAWIAARLPYAPSEAFRFYDGPIDNPESGPEPLINGWPLDENYIDYTRDDPNAGIINDVTKVPAITSAEIDAANEAGGEKNIATGYHAIEFLLWGQDDVTPGLGAGKRPFTDYVVGGTAANQERRGTYLKLVTQNLVTHLTDVANAWKPDVAGNYAATFGVGANAADPKAVLEAQKAFVTDLIRAIGSMANAELSGQRMTVAYKDRDQEDEHSCFSDNTAPDLLGDAVGLQNVWLGKYGAVDGVGLDEIVAEVDPALAAKTTTDLAAALVPLQTLVTLQNAGTPIDVVLKSDDTSEGRVAMLNGIKALKVVGADMESANKALSLSAELEKPSESL